MAGCFFFASGSLGGRPLPASPHLPSRYTHKRTPGIRLNRRASAGMRIPLVYLKFVDNTTEMERKGSSSDESEAGCTFVTFRAFCAVDTTTRCTPRRANLICSSICEEIRLRKHARTLRTYLAGRRPTARKRRDHTCKHGPWVADKTCCFAPSVAVRTYYAYSFSEFSGAVGHDPMWPGEIWEIEPS